MVVAKPDLVLAGKAFGGAGLTGAVLYLVGTVPTHVHVYWPYWLFLALGVVGVVLYFAGREPSDKLARDRHDREQENLLRERQLKLTKVRQTVDTIVSDWRTSALRTIDPATDPDISDVVASSKRHRKFMGDRQPDLLAFSPGIKTRAYALIDDCVRAFVKFESVMDPIDLTWKKNNKDLQAMYENDPEWTARVDVALKELQRRVNSAIDTMDELHGDALVDSMASSNGSDHGPPR